jgi:hypothetical protein
VHDRHRVRLPRLAPVTLSHAAPELDDGFAVELDAARGADLSALAEVLDERPSDRLEILPTEAVDARSLPCLHVT